jgi:signal transduction protein with GAF and PtsI domain
MNSVRENKNQNLQTRKKNIEKLTPSPKYRVSFLIKTTMHSDLNSFLQQTLQEFSCQTGTIHRTTADGENLALLAQMGVPEFLIDKISLIPFGKGIAGAAAARCEPVELCNLQQDLGGVARPDAQKTKVAGSLAVPILAADGTTVLGVLGIGMLEPHDFTEEEKAALIDKSRELREEFMR